MNRFIRKKLNKFEPYQTVPIQHKHVINANESSYNIFNDPLLGPDLIKKIKNAEINRYPDPIQKNLRSKLAIYTDLHEDNITISNGGDEVIGTICHAFLEPGDLVLGHEPSFDIYKIASIIASAEYYVIPDLPGYRTDIDELIVRTRALKPKLVFLCNPNNPTGYLVSEDAVRKLLDCHDSLIILDEAYVEFSQFSLSKLVKEYDNLIVIRTLSKAFGLAGMRIGYALANPSLINVINAVRMPYNVGVLPQLIGSFALDHKEAILAQTEKIISERDRMISILQNAGVKLFPSETNFLLICLQNYEKTLALFDEASILVKAYGKRQSLENCIRITITKPDLNDQIIKILKEDPCEMLK